MLDVSVRVIGPVVVGKEPRQGEMDPKLLIVPFERGRDPEGHLVVVDRLLCLALVAIYYRSRSNRARRETVHPLYLTQHPPALIENIHQ